MNDLISRQAAIDAFNVGAELLRCVLDDADVVGTERAKYEWGLVLIESCISDIKDLPSAQPERKKGKWEKVSADEYRISASYVYRCEECGEVSWYESCFCPNCGAEMER